MLLKELEIFVYKVNNTAFELLGTINKYSSLVWPDSFAGYENFELWAPINDENNELLKEGNIIWIGLDNACVIEHINPQKNEDGIKKYYIKGRSLEKLLEDRIVWGTYIKSGKISEILYDIVDKCCINPVDSKRKIPFLENSIVTPFGEEVTIQKTGGAVYDFILSLVEDTNIGFKIDFNPRLKKLFFKVIEGKDRTTTNLEGNNPIELSTDFDDILSSDYSYNGQNYKNIAFIQGEENEGEPRVSTSVGKISLSGFDRKEFYIDARDLQSEVYEGEIVKRIPKEEYLEMLMNRAIEKLSQRSYEENFSVIIRQKGILQYELDKDYNLGDLITIVDKEIGVRTNARLFSVFREYSDISDVLLNFGKPKLTISEKLTKALKS